MEEFEEIKRNEVSFCGIEMYLYRRTVSPVILEACGRSFFDSAGNLRGYRAVGRDVTARKHAEELKRAYRGS